MIPKIQGSTDNFDIDWIVKDTACWVHFPLQERSPIYQKGVVKGIVPLSFIKGNSKVMIQLESGANIETKASNLEKRRLSNSLQKDLIELQIINGAQILDQLKRRLDQRKIHIYLWNSLIIVNPFVRIEEMYSEQVMHSYTEKVVYHKKQLHEIEPHIYGFICNIINLLRDSYKTQFISISGQSGSGKTQTNKQCLRIISHVCEAHMKSNQLNNSLIEQRILNCDYILECFGNSKTEKNDNSSRFGKLITEKINIQTLEIARCQIRGFFLEKSRIVHQFQGERNFHIFYQLLSFCDQNIKHHLGFKGHKASPTSYAYLGYRCPSYKFDQEMWENLQNAFDVLEFDPKTILEIYQIIAAILHMGNLKFDDHTYSDNDPCEISNDELIPLISNLLMIPAKDLSECLVFHKKVLAGEKMYLPMTEKQCIEGRDSIAKALYENLFLWIVEELTAKVNQQPKGEQNIRVIKLLDIYGFEVFDYNSFEQLNVNYTNQRIHQVYLDQVFKHQKMILEKEGLGSSIPDMKFTDNKKIIDMLDLLPKSVYNLLDESCSLNMRDEDYLNNVKKTFDGHEHFPPKNSISTKRVFIIQHTPGMIEYHTEGFRAKNKDFLREDIIQVIKQSQVGLIKQKFTQQLERIKGEQNKKFLGFKMRKEVNALIHDMSTQSDLHFIRCIKPNQQKKALTFVDRVCYNQIRYLGILDTIVMRKDCYHVRMEYLSFYKKYGILNQNVKQMIDIDKGKSSNSECKEKTRNFLDSNFKDKKLEYLYGNERIFMKMETYNFFQTILKQRMARTNYSCTIIKTIWRHRHNKNKNLNFTVHIKKVQKAVRHYLRDVQMIKKKNSVRVIQREWIKRCDEYFRRKKRGPLMVLQKYIKKVVWKKENSLCINEMKTAKQLLLSFYKTHKVADRYDNYIELRKLFLGEIYDKIWENMKTLENRKIEKYFNSFLIYRKNIKKIDNANDRAKAKLIIRSKNTIEKYLHTVSYSKWFQKFRKAVVKIQRNYRMAKCRQDFQAMKSTVIFIQRKWREYKAKKVASIEFTHKYFGEVRQMEFYMQEPLFRNLNINSLANFHEGFEKTLDKFEKIRKDKLVLFYYLLDLQVLSQDLSLQNWTNQYLTLSQQSLLKLSPIQTLDVANGHTTCCTINKMYSWGCIDLQKNSFNTVSSHPIQQHFIPEGKIHKVSVKDERICVDVINPHKQFFVGQEKGDQTQKQWSTLTQNFVLLNGMILTVSQVSFVKLNMPEKVAQLSCGMGHVIIKTILKKVYTWGKNESGQLGLNNYFEITRYYPKMVQYFIKKKIQAVQVAAGANCSVVLDSNCKIYWFGSNGTVQNCCQPQQCILSNKSSFIGNATKYCPVRLVVSWSKSISTVGVTLACYDGLFKNQISLRRKVIENLMSKWSEDFNTINPPHIQSIAGYIAEKHMPLPSQNHQNSLGKTGISNKQVREKIISEINMIEESERDLLKQRRLKNMNMYESKYRPSKQH